MWARLPDTASICTLLLPSYATIYDCMINRALPTRLGRMRRGRSRLRSAAPSLVLRDSCWTLEADALPLGAVAGVTGASPRSSSSNAFQNACRCPREYSPTARSPFAAARSQRTYRTLLPGAEYIASSKTSSSILRNPRAPVPLPTACRATSRRAGVVIRNVTFEVEKSDSYCARRALRGSIRTRRRSSSLNSRSVATIGTRPTTARTSCRASTMWTRLVRSGKNGRNYANILTLGNETIRVQILWFHEFVQIVLFLANDPFLGVVHGRWRIIRRGTRCVASRACETILDNLFEPYEGARKDE